MINPVKNLKVIIPKFFLGQAQLTSRKRTAGLRVLAFVYSGVFCIGMYERNPPWEHAADFAVMRTKPLTTSTGF